MRVIELLALLSCCDPNAEVRLDCIFPSQQTYSPVRALILMDNEIHLRDYYMQKQGDIILSVAGVEYELVRRLD
jgi:hypothetical protein